MDNINLDRLRKLVDETLASKYSDTGTVPRNLVNRELFAQLRASGLAFILDNFGKEHPYFVEFDKNVRNPFLKDAELAKGILKAIQNN